MHSTTRLGLNVPDTTDDESAFPPVSQQQMTTLDASVIITEGTLVNRPASGSYNGQTYYGTDTSLWYFWTGSAWETVMLAGVWTNLSFGSNISGEGGGYTPAYRLVGDKVELCGGLFNGTGGSLTSNYVLATNLPAPAEQVSLAVEGGGGTASLLIIPASSSHLEFVAGSTVTGFVAGLDGQSYRLS